MSAETVTTWRLNEKPQAIEAECEDGGFWIYAAYGGGVYITARSAHAGMIGCSIPTEALPSLAEAIMRLHASLTEERT